MGSKNEENKKKSIRVDALRIIFNIKIFNYCELLRVMYYMTVGLFVRVKLCICWRLIGKKLYAIISLNLKLYVLVS